MNQARIAELLQPFLGISTQAVISSELGHPEAAKAGEKPALLSPFQLQSISTYINILVRWNARINLTSIRDPEEIVTRHFGESLFAAWMVVWAVFFVYEVTVSRRLARLRDDIERLKQQLREG